MLNWFYQWGQHVFLGLLALDHVWDRIYPLIEKAKKAEEFVEKRWHERRHNMNFVTGLVLAEQEVVKLNTFLAKLPTYLPLIQKNLADLQKAASDKSDPTALLLDSQTLLADLNQDLAILSSLVPAQTPPPAAS